jgi:integrase
MARRDKGDGYLARKPRKDGRFAASFIGSDGQRHYVYGKTRAQAKERLAKAISDREAGVFVAGPGQTVRQFLTSWLAYREARIRASTHRRYAGLIRMYVLPAIGDVTVRKITAQHLADLYSRLLEKQSPASVAQLHNVLHGAFRQAVKWSLIGRNPVEGVTAPKVERSEMHYLTAAEARTLLVGVEGDDLEALYVLACSTGMRLGELLGLQWRNVDLDTGFLRVVGSLVKVDGGWSISATKTPKSRRRLVLGDLTVRALKAHRIKQAEWLLAIGEPPNSDTLVFTNRLGEPLNGWHFTERVFKPLLRRLGLPQVRFHDLRHTAATLMLEQGVHPKVVSEMLGHSSVAITLDRYSHVLPTMQEEAARRMDRVLGGVG